MSSFELIPSQELVDFASALQGHGLLQEDFELQEDVFSPQKAEVEGALGEVGVRYQPTQSVRVYRLGSGMKWVDEFAFDLTEGRFGTRR